MATPCHTKINAWETSSHLSTFISPLPRKFPVVGMSPTFQGGLLQDCTSGHVSGRKPRCQVIRFLLLTLQWHAVAARNLNETSNPVQNDPANPSKSEQRHIITILISTNRPRCIKDAKRKMSHSFPNMSGGQRCLQRASMLSYTVLPTAEFSFVTQMDANHQSLEHLV